MTNCIKCGTPLEPAARFCTACGAECGTEQPKALLCKQCGQEMEPGTRFCEECGADNGAAAPPEQAPATQPTVAQSEPAPATQATPAAQPAPAVQPKQALATKPAAAAVQGAASACGGCGAALKAGAEFCTACGAACGTKCGATVQGQTAPAAPASKPTAGQGQTVKVTVSLAKALMITLDVNIFAGDAKLASLGKGQSVVVEVPVGTKEIVFKSGLIKKTAKIDGNTDTAVNLKWNMITGLLDIA